MLDVGWWMVDVSSKTHPPFHHHYANNVIIKDLCNDHKTTIHNQTSEIGVYVG